MAWVFKRFLSWYWPNPLVGRAYYQRILTVICFAALLAFIATAALLVQKNQALDNILAVFLAVVCLGMVFIPLIPSLTARLEVSTRAILSLKIIATTIVHFRLDGGVAAAAFMALDIAMSARMLCSQRETMNWLLAVATILIAPMFWSHGGYANLDLLQTFSGQIWSMVFFISQAAGLVFCLTITGHYFRGKVRRVLSDAEDKQSNAVAQRNLFQEATHELRTPMNGIMGMSQLLQNTNMSAQQQAFVDTIMASSHQLLLMINELVDYEKIRSGGLELTPKAFELKKLISKTHARLSAIAEQRLIKVVSICEDDAEQWYIADGQRLEQIIFSIGRHLLNRASRGEVLLHVWAANTGGIGVKISFSGAVKTLPDINKKSLNPSAGSDELGFSMAQALLCLMGSELEVDTDGMNKLSYRFSIKAKVSLPPFQQDDTIPQGVIFAPKRPFNILVVEDNETNRAMLREALQAEHVNIHEAALVWQAEKILARVSAIDIILLDLKLPDENGIELLRRIRQSSTSYADVPVVVLTATGDELKLASIRALGVKAIITKPVPLYQIFRHLNSISEEKLGARIDVHDVIS